jgi:hypothetical protein
MAVLRLMIILLIVFLSELTDGVIAIVWLFNNPYLLKSSAALINGVKKSCKILDSKNSLVLN